MIRTIEYIRQDGNTVTALESDNPRVMVAWVSWKFDGNLMVLTHIETYKNKEGTFSLEGNGYATELINRLKQKTNSIFAVPREEWLIGFYRKRGFTGGRGGMIWKR